MPRKIVVSGNCTTGGMAACLRAIFPNAQITPFPLPHIDDADDTERLKLELLSADVWVTIGRFELGQNLELKVVKFPAIAFSAFHPDLCYAMKKSANHLTIPHYNSQIGVWAFNNQIDPADAISLFNYDIFKQAGYLDCWESSVKHLMQVFKVCNLSNDCFNEYFNNMRRRGAFMYSINHPRIEAISELMKLVIKYSDIEVSNSALERDITLIDGLTSEIWPIYPEIGNELGLKGGYIWRVDNTEIDGLKTYLDLSYANYLKQGIMPTDLISVKPIPALELALSNYVNNK